LGKSRPSSIAIWFMHYLFTYSCSLYSLACEHRLCRKSASVVWWLIRHCFAAAHCFKPSPALLYTYLQSCPWVIMKGNECFYVAHISITNHLHTHLNTKPHSTLPSVVHSLFLSLNVYFRGCISRILWCYLHFYWDCGS
jgi:hypothetical protein